MHASPALTKMCVSRFLPLAIFSLNVGGAIFDFCRPANDVLTPAPGEDGYRIWMWCWRLWRALIGDLGGEVAERPAGGRRIIGYASSGAGTDRAWRRCVGSADIRPGGCGRCIAHGAQTHHAS